MLSLSPDNWAYKFIAVPDPAAGADVDYTPPRGIRQLLLSANFWYQTDANVANRTVLIEIFRTPIFTHLRLYPYTQAASLLLYHGATFDAVDVDAVGLGPARVVRLPGLVFLDTFHHLYITAVNGQVGDQFSGIELTVLESIMPAEV